MEVDIHLRSAIIDFTATFRFSAGEDAMTARDVAEVVVLDPQSQVIPVGKMMLRAYTGLYDGIPYTGVVGELRLSQDGHMYLRGVDGDFGFILKLDETVLVPRNGNLELHVMKRGIFTIYGVPLS